MASSFTLLFFAAGSLVFADVLLNGGGLAGYYVLVVASLAFALAGLTLGVFGARKTDRMGLFAASSLGAGMNAVMICVVVANDLFLHGLI